MVTFVCTAGMTGAGLAVVAFGGESLPNRFSGFTFWKNPFFPVFCVEAAGVAAKLEGGVCTKLCSEALAGEVRSAVGTSCAALITGSAGS